MDKTRINKTLKKDTKDTTYKLVIYILSFILPFIIFLKTMNPSSFGYDTTWFHIQIPQLAVGQTTGFPLAFLLGKLFTYLPFGTIAFRLNMFSVFFGAATVTVFTMIVSNLLEKEYLIAFVSTLFFSFFRVFWSQTNRFEVYTLHTFLIGLVILFGIYWVGTKQTKFLYLYYLFIGISFTNHPLSAFLAPALLLFPIFIDHRSVFKLKRVIIIVILVIAPLLLYLYIPIRSYQGYGDIKTFKQFIEYITGANWREQLRIWDLEILKNKTLGYFNLLKSDFNIIATVITVGGFVTLAWKRLNFFFLTLSLIILNFIPILFYETQINNFYLVSIVTFLIIPFSFGLYYVKEEIILLIKKLNKKYIPTKKIMAFCITFSILIMLLPINLFAANFNDMDKSKDTMIYDYWKTVISAIDNNSILISSSKSTSVALYLINYEIKKDVRIEIGLSYDEMMNFVKENINKRSIYFNQAYLPDLSNVFELELVGYSIFWEDYREDLSTFKILGFKKYVDLKPSTENISLNFGDETTISCKIINKSKTEAVKMDSIELKLPKNLKLIGIDESLSDMKVMPGLAGGTYMWTNGPYILEPNEEYIVAVKIKAVGPTILDLQDNSSDEAQDEIIFRITTNNIYETAPAIKVFVK